MGAPRDLPTPDLQPRPSVSSSRGRMLLRVNKSSSGGQSSATWTSTSGDLVSDTDEIDNRKAFVEEYNRLARKYGVRPLIPDYPESSEAEGALPRRNWWSRTFRRTSSQSTENSVKRQRSVSHVTAHIMNLKRDSLKDQDLQGLVRLCGKSFLYLPLEYAPGSLILPTCFRATAQYLVQHAPETRGVFRIPGSVRVVNELYEFYCAEQPGEDVANTVRSPNLPSHINIGVHDVASTFKKFLAGLPGGILGSLSLFDALVAINSQLYTDVEFSRTKQTKIRARLIALAVGTLRSQFRRELICAVFGLLCLLGRAAETAPREDEYGRPLPTSDLMGYNALGIVFGPLLVGDILGSHAVKLADPSAGIFLVPASPGAKPKKDKKKTKESTDEPQPAFLDVDKIHIANDITEMLITNWRDVVRQMRSLNETLSITRHRGRTSTSKDESRQARSLFRPSDDNSNPDKSLGRRASDDHPSIPTSTSSRAVSFKQVDSADDGLDVKKTRPTSTRSASNIRYGSNLGILSPPREESGDEDRNFPGAKTSTPLKSSLRSISKRIQQFQTGKGPGGDEDDLAIPQSSEPAPVVKSPSDSISTHASMRTSEDLTPKKQGLGRSPGTPTAVIVMDYGPRRDTSTTASADRHSSKNPKVLSRADGPPAKKPRPNFPCELDQMTSSAVTPGAKVLSGKSTMRTQPRSSQADSELEQVERTISKSVGSNTEDDSEYVENPCHGETALTGDQMDGAVDQVASGPSCRGSIQDLKGDLKRYGLVDSLPSYLPDQKRRTNPQGARPTKPNDTCALPRKTSRTIPQRQPLKLKISDRGDVKLGASKVRGLAAIFDSAARASPFVPTPGGAVQHKRRETTRVVSPYTSNPSPRASLQSVTSVSSPVSLMSHARNSISPSSTTENGGRRSMIPRLQDLGTAGVSDKTEGKSVSDHAHREELRPTIPKDNPYSTPYRLPTPSRLPVRKKVSTTSSPSLTQLDAQLDGLPRTTKSPFALTARDELRPVGSYSSPVLLSKSTTDYKGLPHLSEHSITSGYSEPLTYSRKSSSLSPSPIRGRGASSLRDQIRSLRQELSSKKEEYTQLCVDFQEFSKESQVSEIVLREDLERSRADCAKWKRRAERAERKVEKFERLAMRFKDAHECGDEKYGRSEQDEFSFISGPDHIDIGDRSSQQRLSARMNYSTRMAPTESSYDGGSLCVAAVDTMSDCSGNTVVRNIIGGRKRATSALWTSVDEFVDFATPELEDAISM